MFPTEEQLVKMPLNRLRYLDINTIEEELLVQKVINSKLIKQPYTKQVKLRVPDINTKEQEIEWQKKIDAERERLREKPQMLEAKEEVLEDIIVEDPLREDLKEDLKEDPNPFRNLEAKGKECCGSLGIRHKKNCPTLK